MSNEVMIRQMQEYDLPKCLELTAQLGYPDNTLQDITQRFHHIHKKKDDELYVATMDHQVVGWLHLEKRWIFEADHRATVSAVVVDEKLRGKGLGKKLMSFAEQWARQNNFKILTLNSSLHRKEAHHFYESLGFTKSKEIYQFTKSI